MTQYILIKSKPELCIYNRKKPTVNTSLSFQNLKPLPPINGSLLTTENANMSVEIENTDGLLTNHLSKIHQCQAEIFQGEYLVFSGYINQVSIGGSVGLTVES